MVQWFTEADGDSLRYCYAYDKVLFDESSPYQKIKVLETPVWGRMLVIDDVVMLTEADEFVYHEMIAHVPVCYHHSPEVVIVIGGGDGGTIRELLKYNGIKKIVLCEIDQMVVDVSRRFFPGIASGFDDPRVELRIGDGIAFVGELKQDADLVLVDSTDPVGPGEGLFTRSFYQSVQKALKPGGLMVAQSESPWAPEPFLRGIYNNIAGGFSTIMPYVAPVPTYPRGYWSWTMGAQEPVGDHSFCSDRFQTVRDSCDYLTEESLRAVFALPAFYRKKLGIG